MKPDIENLQGAWNIVSLEMEGRKYPPGGSQIVIRGDRFTSLNMGAEYSGKVTVDVAATPRTFDLLFETGPEAGNRSLGIYQLDGDTWTICLGLTGKSRPSQFATKPGTGQALEILKRERASAKGKQKLPAADQSADPVAELEGEWSMVSCHQDGHPMDPRFVKSARREFRGNTTTLTVGGKPLMKSRFLADIAKHTIDYPDLRQEGIYKVSGDTLQTCLVVAGEPRPADFTATPGDGRTVSAWTRKKPR
jgi:uncharacterized protein (TIGR03067 family)